MAVGKPRGRDGLVPLYVYDPAVKAKRYAGAFGSPEEAEQEHVRLRALGRRACRRCRKRFQPVRDTEWTCSTECTVAYVPRQRKRTRYRADDHWVYTAYDEAGVVLYVGMTSTGLRRAREHGREMEWWPLVARIDVAHFATRAEAAVAEKTAIEQHQPSFNTLGVKSVGLIVGSQGA